MRKTSPPPVVWPVLPLAVYALIVAAVLLSEDGSGPFRLCEDGLPIVQAAAWALGATSIAGAFLAAYGRWSRNKVLLWLLLWIPIAVVTALAGWLIVFGTGLCGE